MTTLRRPAVPTVTDAPPARSASAVPVGVVLVALVALGFVLRCWGALGNGLNLDESFTTVAGRAPLGEMLDFLRARDAHPPLDYLLRVPLARAGTGDLGMRMPSIVWSTGALACLAWWLRDRGWFAFLAVGLMAVSGYQIFYGYEARMYALLALLGVVAAMTADAWWTRPGTGPTVVIAVVVLLAVFDHVSGLFLALGLCTVPGLRRDADAWRWRIAVVGPVAVFAVVWGPALLEQRHNAHTPAPATSPAAIADTVGAQVTTLAGLAGLALVAVVAGLCALRVVAPPVFRAAIACAVVPFAAAALAGLVTPVLIPRFVVAFGWVVPVALAAGLVWLAVRMRLLAVAAGVVLALAVLTSTVRTLTVEWPADRAMGHLQAVVEPGDVVATSPAWYAALLDRTFAAAGPEASPRQVDLPGLDDTYAFVVGDASRSGRVWLLRPVGSGTTVTGPTCAPPWTDGHARVVCFTR